MQTHLKVVGWLFIVFGALGILAAIFGGMLLGGLGVAVGSQPDQDAAAVGALMGLIGMGVMTVIAILSVPGILAGWGILQQKNWGRILGIICAIFQLISFPFGTIFGVYALWVLFNKDTQPLFGVSPA